MRTTLGIDEGVFARLRAALRPDAAGPVMTGRNGLPVLLATASSRRKRLNSSTRFATSCLNDLSARCEHPWWDKLISVCRQR